MEYKQGLVGTGKATEDSYDEKEYRISFRGFPNIMEIQK